MAFISGYTRTTLYFVGYYIIDHYTQAEATKLSYLELVMKIVSWYEITVFCKQKKKGQNQINTCF